ncbi:SIS domain-containing protein [Kineosporia babensis]|uniref:Phosphoheptose isomerase n=1 Tax=Kineosporia babensis TaxID=499548 RepID=A0A9X1SVU4_9ACTN|nr:SIS domain-containing protein [Kineosporia babensis]
MDVVVGEALRQAARVKTLARDALGPQVVEASRRLAECLDGERRAYVVGNGGSAADAQHFAAEFTGRFHRARRPLPVLALSTDTSVLTGVGNDFGFDAVFARQVEAFGRQGDILFAISASGNSSNVVEAARIAQKKGVFVVGLTGRHPAALDRHCDLLLKVPSVVTARIQECQMTLLHIVCDLTERLLLGSADEPADESTILPGKLLAMREEWRQQRLTVVSTNGCFDVLHAGHLDSLSRAAALGDVLVVLLNSDASVRRVKGPGRPFSSQGGRAVLLQALEPVDYVCIFDQDDPAAALAELQPDVHCKGSEYAAALPEREIVERFGGRVEFLPRIIDLSSTQLIERLDVV